MQVLIQKVLTLLLVLIKLFVKKAITQDEIERSNAISEAYENSEKGKREADAHQRV